MAKLIWLVLAAAFLWSAYWFIGSAAVKRGIDDALTDLRAEGWRVETAGVRMRGFPNRFDTIIIEPDMASPQGGFAWSAPFVQILALSYLPNRVIAVFPDTQNLRLPTGALELASSRARGSINMAPSTALTLNRSRFVIDDPHIRGDRLDLTAKSLLFATRQPDGAEGGEVQNIGLSLDGLRLGSRPGEAFGTARLDATLRFDAPIDRHALQGGLPDILSMDIADLKVSWGEIAVSASGALEVAADGYLSGELAVELANWPAALKLSTGMGMLPAAQADSIEQALQFFTALSGRPDTLSAPLVFRDGKVFLGPVPLGPSPRLRDPDAR